MLIDQIITGDAMELSDQIEDDSVDLIFTDPVYDNLDDYAWLSRTAARVLKPDKPCLAWCATYNLPEVIAVMKEHLTYAWLIASQKSGAIYPGRTGICVITYLIWMEKGRSKPCTASADWYKEGNNPYPDLRNDHQWSKPIEVLAKWLGVFSRAGDLIFDPFTGGGSVPRACKMLGRHFVAFEIDEAISDNARSNLINTQPPLFVVEAADQKTMFE